MRLAGYLTGVMGTGEHARQLASALRTQEIAVTTTTLHGPGALEDEELARTDGDRARVDPFADFNLLCVNADSVPHVADQLGEGFFAGRYTIGFWAWEVAAFPDEFRSAFGELDEVWVGSRHVRDAVAPVATVPVTAIPQPVSLAALAGESEAPPGLAAGFRFLFAFDYLSVFERKNPLAAVDAFSRAFGPGSGASIVVKSLNHDHDPAAHERLRAAAARHPDVHLIEHRLDRAERDGLMNAADCYVSLHRAEGFGYTLAESMWLGKPVIATGYSGNLDYMTAENSYLVDHRLIPIGPGSDPYPASGSWAEPDVDHAAQLMREVFEHPEEAARRGRQAASDIRSTHGPEVAGRAMAERLDAIRSSPAWVARGRRPRAASTRRRRLKALDERIRSAPDSPTPGRLRRARGLARQGVLRLAKPATSPQRQVNQALLAALEQLQGEVHRRLRSPDGG